MSNNESVMIILSEQPDFQRNSPQKSLIEEEIKQDEEAKLLSMIKYGQTSEEYPDVLIVDDMAFNITALKAQLDVHGVSVDIAMNGTKAIEKVHKRLKNVEN